jgi:hypothetical protein
MTWDIMPGKEQDYFEFVVRDFVPGMQKLGLQPSDAWLTYFGDYPQIMAGFLMPGLVEIESLLVSDDWDDIKTQLMDYVENFDYKVIPAKNGFQL